MSIKKHIPNTITCCNLISGCIATSFAFGGSPKLALLWIIIGAMFDFFDGMSARLLHVSSPIGKELDSLADDVTFGVAPATIVFSQLYVMEYPSFSREFATCVALCSLYHRSILGTETGEIQSRRKTVYLFYWCAYSCQRSLLGFADCLQSRMAHRPQLVDIHHLGTHPYHQLPVGM